MLKIAPHLSLPIEAVTQTFALLARRGAGKTHTASVIAEEMLDAGFPIVVLDPVGVWYGLRSLYPVAIFGGEHADVPLQATGGKLVADFLVEKRISVILDLSSFGENEMRRFVGEFCQRFYEKNRQPVHVFIDEADEFAPQSASGGEIAKCLGAMQNIVRRGRARGIGVTLITQRSAVLNKSVLTQTECLIAMQTTAPHDLKAIEDWVKYHGTADECRELINSLPKLQQGEAWVYSPGWLKILKQVKFRPRKSFDSSRTPQPGKKRQSPANLAEVDLSKLTKEMVATIEKAKADDPKELRKKIAELEKQLKAKPAPAADPAAVDRAIAAAVAVRDREWHATVKDRDRVIGDFKGRLGKIESLAHVNGDAAPKVDAPAKVLTSQVNEMRPAQPKTVYQPRKQIPAGDSNLPKAERAILTAFYWLRDEAVTPAKVGFYARYSASSGGFNNALGKLRSAGLLQGWTITAEGIAAAEAIGAESKPTGATLREYLRRRLGKAENAILDALIESHPNRLTSAELGEASGYSSNSGGFNNALGRLRSIEAAEGYERDGGTKAADVFFEE